MEAPAVSDNVSSPDNVSGPDTVIGRPVRAPWARCVGDIAIELGIEQDVLCCLLQSLGMWWVITPTRQISAPDEIRTRLWIRSLNLLSVLQSFSNPDGSGWVPGAAATPEANGTADPAATCLPRRPTDVDRIEALVRADPVRYDGLRGRWLVGAVLSGMFEHTASRRILRERGTALSDIELALRRVYPKPGTVPVAGAFVSSVFGELARLHRGRQVFLFVQERDGVQTLVDERRGDGRGTPSGGLPRPTDDYEPGAIVWVSMEESRHGRRSRLRHPVLLISRTGRRGDKWIVLSMTSEIDEPSEQRRVPGAAELGLERSGYLWHETQKVYKTQLGNRVGWVTRELALAAQRVVGLRQSTVDELIDAADRHHGPPAE